MSITKSSITATWWTASATRGVTFVDNIDEVPDGGLVVYSAHGISPEVRRRAKERRLVEVDATCPLVTKVHMEVLRYVRDGYTIIFIGHRKHDEAIGTVGEAPNSIIVVETPEEAASLKVKPNAKLAYVTQTTLSVSDAQRVIDALKLRFPNIRYPAKDDICYATTNRQNAVTSMSPDVDLGPGDRQQEQLEQPAAGRAGPGGGQTGVFDRR